MIRLLFALVLALLACACSAAPQDEENVAKIEQGLCSIPGPLWLKKQFNIAPGTQPRFISSTCPSAKLPGTVKFFSLKLAGTTTPPAGDDFWNPSPPQYTSTWIDTDPPDPWWNRAPEHYCAPYTERVTAEWLMVEISPLPLKTRHTNTVHWYPGDAYGWDMNPPSYYHGYDYGTATFIRSTRWASGQTCSQRWEFDWVGVEPSF